MLLTVQAVVVALGALPGLLARRASISASERGGLGFALVYLLYPATEWLTLNEFHPVALACPFLLFAYWYLDEGRLVPFAIWATLGDDDEGGGRPGRRGHGRLVRDPRRPKAGAAIAGAGLLVSALAIAVVVPHYNNGGVDVLRALRRGRRVGRRDREDALHPPLDARSSRRSRAATSTTCCTCSRRSRSCSSSPRSSLVAVVPELALNQLSETPTQTSIHFHYTAAAIPPLVVATVLGAAWLGRRHPTRRARSSPARSSSPSSRTSGSARSRSGSGSPAARTSRRTTGA